MIDDAGTVKATIDQFGTAPSVVWSDSQPTVYPEGTPTPLLLDELDRNNIPQGFDATSDEKNADGQFVGTIQFEGISQAALFDPASGGIVPLGVLPGHSESRARAVNDAGDVVGFSRAADGTQHAVLWTDTDATPRIIDLGTLPGHVNSEALEINNTGLIVGFSDDGQNPGDAVLWRVQGAPTLDLSVSATLLHPRIRMITVNGVLQPEVAPALISLRASLASGGTPVSDAEVSVAGEVIPESGHDHVVAPIALTSPNMAITQGGTDEGLPLAGHFRFDGERTADITATTDMNGMLDAEFVAGLLGTRLWVIATANLAGETVADTVTLTVVVPNLVDLEQELAPSDPDIYWVGPTAEHSENWYVNQDLVTPLSFVASTMRSSLEGTLLYLQYNDASLPLGGAFTFTLPGESATGRVFEDPFQRPHRSHANGLDIDIAWCYAMQRGNDGGVNRVRGTNCRLPGGATPNPMLRVNLLRLQRAAADQGGVALPHNGTHYHIRFR